MEVMHDRCFSHESIVNSLVIDGGWWWASVGTVMIENVFPAHGRDSSRVSDRIPTAPLKAIYVGSARKL
jgi:hypothetical protein